MPSTAFGTRPATGTQRLMTSSAAITLHNAANINIYQIPDGKYTITIYSLIKNGRFNDAVKCLRHLQQQQLQQQSTLYATAYSGGNGPKPSRSLLSLLAYCQYQDQSFQESAETYRLLVEHYPDIDPYKLYFAQALYKAGDYEAALTACLNVNQPDYVDSSFKLQAAIKFQMDDLNGAKSILDQSLRKDDITTIANRGCLLFKSGKFDEAQKCFQEALKLEGYTPELTYYTALTFYMQHRYVDALKCLAEIIEHGIKEHPEFNIGMGSEHPDNVITISNSEVLHQSHLIEAFNLKAAVEYTLKNYTAAKEAIRDMPPRQEQDLDPISLHNLAVTQFEDDSTAGYDKLRFLISLNPAPAETLHNILVFFLKNQFYDAAADLIAQFAASTNDLLEPTVVIWQVAPDECFRRLDTMATEITDHLRRLSKDIQTARQMVDEEKLRALIRLFDDAVDELLPVILFQAKIHWTQRNYAMVERVLRKPMEFCNDHDSWRLNVAHVFFMQEKFRDAIAFYEPMVRDHYEDLLSVSPIVFANLCVSYIMTYQNEIAEDLMRRVEKEEEMASIHDSSKQYLHLCIVNLVIGTLYCTKGNYEFGISRIIKSFEPLDKKLSTETWSLAKRCLLSLLEVLAKHMILFKDQSMEELVQFLDDCEASGKNVSTITDSLIGEVEEKSFKQTVAYEARRLKSLFLQLYE